MYLQCQQPVFVLFVYTSIKPLIMWVNAQGHEQVDVCKKKSKMLSLVKIGCVRKPKSKIVLGLIDD